jgi:hypothetical protein
VTAGLEKISVHVAKAPPSKAGKAARRGAACAAVRRHGHRDQRANLPSRRFHLSPALSVVFKTHFSRMARPVRADESRAISGSLALAGCAAGVGAVDCAWRFGLLGFV